MLVTSNSYNCLYINPFNKLIFDFPLIVIHFIITPKKSNCLVVLHNFFGVGAGRVDIFLKFFFFFFPNQSLSQPLHLPIKVQISLLNQKKTLYTTFKPVIKCKQVDNNNSKDISKRSKFSKKKKKKKKKNTFLEF